MQLTMILGSAIGLLLIKSAFAADNVTTAPATQTIDRNALIRTPPVSPAPKINGPRVYGQRTGKPFFYHVPVSGNRPITIIATGLPDGLSIDSSTGDIAGRVKIAGEYTVQITATNSIGVDSANLKIVIGDKLALTPPMGWNTYNAFRMKIDDALIRSQADAMVSTGLINYGYTYLNLDDGWQGQRDKTSGIIAGNSHFPDLKSLGDYIHSKSLKFGIYSSPGPRTCALFEGSFEHEYLDAKTYADWGVDFVKYDWCSYEGISQLHAADHLGKFFPAEKIARLKEVIRARMPLQENRKRPRPPEIAKPLQELTDEYNSIIDSIPKEEYQKIRQEMLIEPYKLFGDSLQNLDRDIVYSLCQYGMGNPGQWARSVHGNLWRTTRDITPRWGAMKLIIDQQTGLEKDSGPGHWNDPDMLEIGNPLLPPEEMHMQMTIWSMLAAPILIGTDLRKIDELTFSVLANAEVLAVNQDQLGKQGLVAKQMGDYHIWTRPLSDGTTAVAILNRSDAKATITAVLSEIGLNGDLPIRDLWRQKDLAASDRITLDVGPHGAEMFKVGKPLIK